MIGHRLFFAAIVLVVIAGAFVIFGGRDNPLTQQVLSTFNQGQGGLSWSVGSEKDKLTDQVTLQASATHDMDDGGKVYLTGTCDENDLMIEFEYHARDKDKGTFETQGTDEVVHIPYRLDDGGVQELISKTNYNNTAQAVFAYEPPGDKNQPNDVSSSILNMTASLVKAFLPGLGPQDLRAFLHAREVRFQLPLDGGKTEVVKVYPQDASFGKFLAACKIDVKRYDSEIAAQEAAKKAEEEKKAADEKAAQEAQQQQLQEQQAAEQRRQEALKQACMTGQGDLQITGTTVVEGAAHGIVAIYAFNGQSVQPIADPDAVNGSKCTITFTRGNSTIQGTVPLNYLTVVADASAPPASSAPDTSTGR
jgi:hypothetical protein